MMKNIIFTLLIAVLFVCSAVLCLYVGRKNDIKRLKVLLETENGSKIEHFFKNSKIKDYNIFIKTYLPDWNPFESIINFTKDTEIIELLLKHGISPNFIGKSGRTPLGIFISNPYAVKLLLEYGADPNLKDRREPYTPQTPLYLAISCLEEYSAFDKCKEQIESFDLPDNYVKPDYLSTIYLLIEHGADVNQGMDYILLRSMEVPLVPAIQRGRLDVIKLLLKYGADPNISGYMGETAFDICQKTLHFKTEKEQKVALKLLKKASLEINANKNSIIK